MEQRFQNYSLETSNREVVRALQFERLQNVMDAAWATNRFYREQWAAAGVHSSCIKSIEDFTARIPVVRKHDFMADQEEHPPFGWRHEHAISKGEQMVICTTSGTSGQGVEVHASTESESRMATEVYAFGFRWAGLMPGDSIFLNYPVTLLGGGRIELRGAEGYGLTVYPIGNYDAARKLELLERFQPDGIMSTTSYLGHLAAVSQTLPPSSKLKTMMGGGESGGYAWLERLTEQWDVPLFNHYGATQTRVDHMFPCERNIGSRTTPGMLHNIDPYFLMEVVDRNTGDQVSDGDEGEIVVTSLFYKDVPLIRCAMGDRAVYHEASYCPCHRPFCGVEIGSIARIDDMKKVKGVNIWPEAIDDVLFGFDNIDEYQITLDSDKTEADLATIHIRPYDKPEAQNDAAFINSVATALQKRMGINFVVELGLPGSLPRSEWKARRWIDNRVHQQK